MRKLWRVLFILAALLLLPAFALADGDNLLKNGGFESIDSDGLPSFWYTDAWVRQEGVTVYSATHDARTGENAALVKNYGSNDARFAQKVKVEPETMYRLSGWIKVADMQDSGRGANLSIEGLGNAYSACLYEPSAEWVYVELYGETGEDQKEITVYARVGGYSGESIGSAAFDDLELVRVDELPTGVYARAWYTPKQAASVDNVGIAEDAEVVAEAFWPWLIVLGFGYCAVAVWLMRHLQLDRREEALLEASRPHGKFRVDMPVFALVGLALAAVLRIVIALNIEGYQVDVNCFTAWGNTMLRVGPAWFYQSNWCDYTPGYIYIMGLNGALANWLSGVVKPAFVHKLIPMACDLLGAWLVYRLARENRCSRKQAGVLSLVMAFNPAMILNSAAWCQIDSVLCVGLMLVAYLAIRRRWSLVLPVYVLCALIKPQALMLGFLGLAAIVMALLEPKDKSDRKALFREFGIGLAASLALALLIVLPFSPNQESAGWLFQLYEDTLASYPYATVNTANLFYLIGANWQAIVHDASAVVIALMLVLCLAWAAYTFLSRKDRKLSWFVPAVTLLALVMIVTAAMSVLSLRAGDGLTGGVILSRNSWTVEQVQVDTSWEWVRTFTPDQPGAWHVTLPNWLMLTLSVLAAVGIILLILRRKQHAAAWPIDWSLVEPVIALFFAQAFALMLIFDTSWTQLGIFSMALAFFLVLPMYIRSGKLEHLPLCGAVIFLLLYVFGIKMHERYLFPALFLLGMAYAIRRDRRILGLLIGASAVLFIGEGIVLDNSIRLGSSMGHLNNDTKALANLLSVLNVGFALFSVWTCHRVCVADAPVRYAASIGEPILPVREHEQHPCTPLTFKPSADLKIRRVDVLLMVVVTALYSIVALTTLGSTKGPENAWKSTAVDEYVYIDLGQSYDDFTMLYNCQVSYRNFALSVSETGEDGDWSQPYWAEMNEGQCWRWKYVTPSTQTDAGVTFTSVRTVDQVQKLSGRFVRIDPRQIGLTINEVIFRDAQGKRIAATVMGSENANVDSPLYTAPENLLDEQDTLPDGEEPGWWNGTYFDEIYHARTAYEHRMGTATYETSHPPLGKVIMSWFVSILGMTPFGWRFGGALCGILMLPAMYLLVKQMFKRTDLAFVAMTLMALDCMHFTQTRIATIDSYPVLFIILSWWFMLRFMQRDIVRDDMKKVLPDLALSGLFMGLGFASKWIGAYSGIGLAVMYFWTCARHLRMGSVARDMNADGKSYTREERDLLTLRAETSFKRVVQLCLWCLLFFVAVPLVIYIASYVPALAYRDFDSVGEYLKAVWDNQEYMLWYHGEPGRGMDHPFYSPWYEWPLMACPMYYASPSFTPDGWSYAIFCFGNPWVWVVGLAGIGYAAYCFLRNHRYRLHGAESTFQLFADTWNVIPAFVLVGLLAQFLPWLLVPRGTYIYHYFASVPFLILGTVMLIERLTRSGKKGGRIVCAVYLALCLVWFILLFPHASGVLTPEGWLDFVEDYPYISLIPEYWKSSFLSDLNAFLEKIPVFPHVYH